MMNATLGIGIVIIVIGTIISLFVALNSDRKIGTIIYGFSISSVVACIFWAVLAIINLLVFLTNSAVGYFTVTLPNKTITDTIMFAGKVVNPNTGEWNNNRLVLVFERDKEIGRTITFRGEFPENNLGIIDGLFTIEIPNTYQFNLSDFAANKVPLDFHLTSRSSGFLSNRKIIYHWFPSFNEGSWQPIIMPSKNLYYVIYVLSGDVSTLPPEIMGEKTEFQLGRLVIVPKVQIPPEVNQAAGNYTLQNVVYKVSTDNTVINKVTEPLDNCNSNTSLQTLYSYAQTFIHKYTKEDTQGGGVSISIPDFEWAKIVLELQSKYGFEDDQIDSSSITYNMQAVSSSHFSYQL